ncbi:MAG: hypothetical protein ACJ786_18260 [Catenulispora sp.]
MTRSRYSASSRRRYRCTATPLINVTMSVRFMNPQVALVASAIGRASTRSIS